MRIGSFNPSPPGATFRGWLWTITRNQLRDHWRRRRRQPQASGGTTAQERLAALPADAPLDSGSGSSSTGPGSLYRRAVDLLRDEFEERTWRAFWCVAVDGRLPADVAEELGVSLNAVYLAKSRVLRRLREEFGDLLA